jgi:hypothetical protein
MQTIPSLEDFVSTEHSVFEVRFSDITIRLELVEAVPLPPPTDAPGTPSSLRKMPFSLLFKGPRETPLNQDTYRLTHDSLGNVDLLLVPMSQDGGDVFYAATIT